MAYKPDWEAALPRLLDNATEEYKQRWMRSYRTGIASSKPRSAGSAATFLSQNHLCSLLIDWHEQGSLNEVKQLAYTSAKLGRMVYLYRPDAGLAYGTYRMFTALLSDEPNILHWFTWHVLPCLTGAKGRVPDYLQPGKLQFHAFNCHLALIGEFDWLAERTEQALADGVKLKAGKSYRFDYLFFKALVEGDKQAMEDNIHALLKGKVAHTRNNEHGMAYQSKVVSTWGVMLSKMAYRHGYELDIDSPWVPKEWLPVKPLAHYSEDIDFMSEFDVFTPFRAESWYFKNASDFSPKSLLEVQPNIREWVEGVVRDFP